MAERRMFAKSVVMSDAFLDLPAGARCLYFSLGIQADDDGFVNAPNSTIRMCGACPDDIRLLAAKGFLLFFDSGVVAIRHWFVHNQMRKDRYRPTSCQAELETLVKDSNNVYQVRGTSEAEAPWQPSGNQVATQDRIGKDRSGKASLGEGMPAGPEPFVAPTLEQIAAYCLQRSNHVNPESFYDYYSSNGWKVGKGAMKDWKAAIRRWEKNGLDQPQSTVFRPDGTFTMLGPNKVEEIQEYMNRSICFGTPGDLVD